MKTAEELAAEAQAVIDAKAKEDAQAAEAKRLLDEKAKGQAPPTMTLEEAQKVIKDLRDENAKHRTSNKGLEEKVSKITDGLKGIFGDESDEDLTAEQRLETLETRIAEDREKREAQENKMALIELATEFKIPQGEQDYFEFLLEKKLNGLGENEELSDEMIEEVAKTVRSKSAPTSTTVGLQRTPAPADPANATLSVEDFCKMSMSEKSALYQKDQTTYNKLMGAARDQRKLV